MNRIKDCFNALKGKSKREMLVYFMINILIINSYTTLFGLVFALDLPPALGHTLTNRFEIILCIIAGIFIGIFIALVIYFIGIILNLSRFGEWRFRRACRVKKIERREHKERLLPLYREVYERVVDKNTSISKNIQLFINDEECPNAFAIGQNTICVTKGLLTLSDEQIKGILAHEFAHISNKDTELQLVIYGGNFLLSLYFRIWDIICTALEEKSVIMASLIRVVTYGWLKYPLDLLLRKASRNDEFEADKFAADLGYGNDLIEALDLIAQGGYSKSLIERLYSTHPETDRRIVVIEQHMESIGAY